MLFTSIFSFSLNVFKKLLTTFKIKALENTGKRKKCWFPAFSAFPTVFSTLSKRKTIILATFICRLQMLIFQSRLKFFISCFPVGYREISVKIFFDLTLVAPVKIRICICWLPRLIVHASQPDGNMTSFTLNFSRLT